jgi:nitroreductase/NAD-dependent dihydropyrimidine dehydrogenase PreA subunit
MLQFRVDSEKCDQCDACVKDCPSGILRRQGGTPEAAAADCLECQHCLAVCPAGAISVFGLNPADSLPLSDGAIPSLRQMKTFIRGRRSVRQFLDEDIPAVLIDELLTDLAHAPSGCNARDLTFSVVSGRKAMAALLEKLIQAIETKRREIPSGFVLEAVEAYRKNGRDLIFLGAPHLLVVSHGEKAICSREDVVLALAYFELLAQSAGLGTTWCGMIKFIADMIPEVYEWFGLDPKTYFYAMMFGQPAVRYARTVQRDSAARIRRIDFA